MSKRSRSEMRVPGGPGSTRRTFLKQVGAASLAAAGASAWRPRASVAASPVKLSIWTGYPEVEPFYKKAAEEYAKTHPGFQLETLSSQLREMEQKLTASIPTDTGPDLFDIGRNITISFCDAGLLPPNPPKVMSLVKSKAYHPVVVEYNTWKGQVYGIPFLEGSKPALFYNTKMFTEAGLDPKKPPTTFDELMAAARKLAKKDASGNLVRAGISLRLSGQGAGVAEKFWYVLYAMGGDPIVQTKSGKWHNNYDNEAGRAALKFYIDAVHKYQVDDTKLQHDAAAFASEQAAMLMREAWVIGELKAKGPEGRVQHGGGPAGQALGGHDAALEPVRDQEHQEPGRRLGLRPVPGEPAHGRPAGPDDGLDVHARGRGLGPGPEGDPAVQAVPGVGQGPGPLRRAGHPGLG